VTEDQAKPLISDHWVTVAQSSAIVDGKAIEVVVNELIIAIFRSEGNLYALDGMCAHQGGPIADGEVKASCVTCPWHGWQYELATGIQTINRNPLQQVYQVRERDGDVQLLLEI
jgi:nitrite reductase/ring-hydroxylating ferredoxin subunit